MEPRDRTTEYAALASYHTAVVQSRFTIAGLYSAALGVLLAAEFNHEISLQAKLGLAAAGAWLTLALWVVELRSRALYTCIAHRGIEIEHEDWGLVGGEWYKGLFSRQYKEPPSETESLEVPPRPDPDSVSLTLPFLPKPLRLRPSVSAFVTHSRGFDLLYFGGLVTWIGLLVWRAVQAA